MRLKQTIKRWIRKIRKIIDYLPILWKDEDFDHGYITILYHYKLKRSREHMEEHQLFVGWEKVVKDMKRAEDALARLADEDNFDFKQREKDRRIAFNTIRDHLDEWWD